jgi:hypothetical protein
VDLGLALLACRREPGTRFSHAEIAAWCGCSKSYIYRLEKQALVKIKKSLVNELRELR